MIVLILVGLGAITIAVAWYRLSHRKDTHYLKELTDRSCNTYIAKGKSPGLCIGIIKGEQLYIKGYGRIDSTDARVPDGKTLFEIGSVSKVFTVAMTQLLVDKGLLHWKDDIRQYHPPGEAPFNTGPVSLEQLASHTSGFPRLPAAWLDTSVMTNECDPYSTITEQQLLSYLRHPDDKKPVPAGYDYSNVGMGLLGHILEWRTGKSYDTLLKDLLCNPLGMTSTSLQVKDTARFADGHDESGKTTCHWQFPVLQGAGGIRSCVDDLVIFLRENMEDTGPLGVSFNKLHKKVADIPMGGIGYGWHLDEFNARLYGEPAIIWHNGGTGGFSSFIGFIPGKAGVVVLANQYNPSLDRLALNLLSTAAKVSF